MRSIALLLVMACSGATASAERSYVRCGPCEARPDGRAQVEVQVTLRDPLGRPLEGRRVLFSGVDAGVTGTDGVASLKLSSTRAGSRTIDVRLPDGTPLGSVAVGFFAGSFPRVEARIP